MGLFDFSTPEALQFREWVLGACTGPGVLVLTYEPDNVIPIGYQFNAAEPDAKPSVGIRAFLQDYDGEIRNVEYCTAYPQFYDAETEEEVEATDSEMLSQLWRIGWESLMETAAEMVGVMQSEYMYSEAERLGVDMDKMMEETEEFLPWDLSLQFCVTYLRFVRMRDKITHMPEGQRLVRTKFMLDLIGEMLSGVEGVAKGAQD